MFRGFRVLMSVGAVYAGAYLCFSALVDTESTRDHSLMFVFLFCFMVTALTIIWLIYRFNKGVSAIKHGLEFFRDGDFSVGLHNNGSSEFRDVLDLYNLTASSLRQERQNLLQRELLFESVIQNADLSLVLTGVDHQIFYANASAETLFNDGKSIVNDDFLVSACAFSRSLSELMTKKSDGIVTVNSLGINRTYHLSCGEFTINGEVHYLFIVKEMTDQLASNEVDIWKTAIKVISHELNNSLAPISSVAQSGVMLLEKSRYSMLPAVFETIFDRANHLSSFVEGYSTYAKLPLPNKQYIEWGDVIDNLQQSYYFRLVGELPVTKGYFDPVQMERVLLNVLKNAHDSGSKKEEVSLLVEQVGNVNRIVISDRGCGMSSEVFENAFLPFYSTKASGTGVGLALSQEVIKAHSGLLTIVNRHHGGVSVTIEIPSEP